MTIKEVQLLYKKPLMKVMPFQTMVPWRGDLLDEYKRVWFEDFFLLR
jgi:hypothetical protein